MNLVAAMLLLAAVARAGALDPPGLERGLDPKSPFLRELYARSVDADFEELMVDAELLGLARRFDEAATLKAIAERRRLLQLLGERADSGKTIGEALKAGRPDLMALRALTERALGAVEIQQVERVRSERDGELTKAVVALSVRNGTAKPIESFTVNVQDQQAQPPYMLFLRCSVAEGAPLPPGGRASVACSGSEREPFAGAAIDVLRETRSARPLTVDNLRVGGLKGLVTSLPLTSSVSAPHLEEARRRILAADCTRLGNCRDVARVQLDRPPPYVPLPAQALARTAPFLQERYRQKADQDDAALLTIADVFRFTDNTNEYRLLEAVVQRRTLKRLLGEPYALEGDIETAIRREEAEGETIVALRRRALAAIDATLEKNSVTTSASGNRVEVRASATARNGLGDALTRFGLKVEGKGAEYEYWLHLNCKPGQPIVPGTTGTADCKGDGVAERMAPAIAKLEAGNETRPWSVSSMELARQRLLVTPELVRYDDKVTPYGDAARAQIASADCASLGRCEQVGALRQAGAEVVMLRNAFPLVYLAMVLAIGTALIAAARRYAPFHQTSGILGSGLAGLVLLGALAEIVLGFFLTLQSGRGTEGLVALVLGFYLAIPLLILWLVHALVLAVNRAHRTPFALFVLGLGLAVPVLWGVVFVLHDHFR